MFRILKNYGKIKNLDAKGFNLNNVKYQINTFQTTYKYNHLNPDYLNKQDQRIKYIFLMNDKYSINPEKEIKLIQSGENIFSKKFNKYENDNQPKSSALYKNLKKKLSLVFLPRDFPNSVKDGYDHFTKYSFFCGICYHIMSFLSTQALITSLNLQVTKTLSYSISAGMNWVLKDGFGQLGAIFFAAKYSNPIERDLKKWRVISLYMYNASILFECFTLLSPQYFIFIASFATLCKLSAFVANSSSRTGINNHFCLENNITDLTNKNFAQNNLCFMIGSLTGFFLSLSISMSFNVVFPILIFISTFHLISAHVSCHKILLNDLNTQRAYYIAKSCLENNKILEVLEVNKMEKMFFNDLKCVKFCNYPLDKLLSKEKNNIYINDILNVFEDQKFLVYVQLKRSILGTYKYKIFTFLRVDAANEDKLIAFLYSVKLNDLLNKNKLNQEEILIELKENLEFFSNLNIKDLMHSLKNKGWDTNFHLLEEKYQRYQMLFK